MARAIVIATLLVVVPAISARAQAPGVDAAVDAASEDAPRPRATPERWEYGRSHWQPQWERFGWWNVALTLGAEAAALTIYFVATDPVVRWTQPLPLDRAAQRAFALDTVDDQQMINTVSHVILETMIIWPFLMDSLLLAGAVHGDTDTMLQMLLISAETTAVAQLVTWATNRLTGRVRPRHMDCAPNGTCSDTGMGPVASFASGHALMTYASAGLTCVHHIMNPWILGSSEGAAAMCASSLTLATSVGFLRLMSDLHWASDVVISSVIGSLIGWGMPLALHYARPRPQASGRRADGAQSFTMIVRPGAGDEITGLTLSGIF
ncbi:phosphatase PAP2 family protein [Sandaracinus amylolyticus]|uniref:Phosphatidic acid phosphatase type 2/haloperoxidase domain-containing protein n=1 Tax=Sandaracinus amylolyticus TaxID=927083 RepID=A0A0F6YG00_9BACT|nr:phosphatase PAP2 family protein [Sandaracinus amylolyticus]AKF04172.1 hypothetical protein DB32_001321 [Sandaracinus amylolyticus]